MTISLDSLFLFYTFLMIGQLREISYCITHIDDKENSAEKAVEKCVLQYNTLLKCRSNLEKIYGPIILAMIICNAVMLCTLIYQLTQMKTISILKGANFFAFVVTKLLQTFIYSWCGTSLTKESEDYRIAIYSANWYGDKRLMKAIIIMLKQKPLVLTACNFSNVSIDIFTKILNTTISYYFLLKTLA
ncbi:odorant receptor 4-like [Chelonus insularis]|uniref:odorant receptor 4-like n=1 Tax=Chelonus insularis TaxID=460826 RepID=UPI00158E3917|nr:odorant receptor 4-like [Chelonus insularis]